MISIIELKVNPFIEKSKKSLKTGLLKGCIDSIERLASRD